VNEPGLAGHAIVQIGEILRRRGDLTGAEAAFARARELGVDPQPGLALIRLAERKIAAARAGLRLALADEQASPRRARLLSALVDVSLAGGDVDGARGAADELRGLAVAMDLPAFRAAADAAEGALALANGDVTGALTASRRACAAWQDLKLPYEAALSRVAIGTTLLEGGDAEGARAELRAALATFESLGASADAARARSRIGGHDRLPGGLTAREVEVLRLVAAGKTNRDIAVELVISEHTVARHLQNLFAKIHVNSRAAATAYAFEHDLA
jgi:DNA-binding CsgD family transcriptional regulator